METSTHDLDMCVGRLDRAPQRSEARGVITQEDG